MKKKILSKLSIVMVLFCTVFCGAGCKQNEEPKFKVNLEIAKVAKTSLALSINPEPAEIQFTDNTPVLLETFGSEKYEFINISLSGLVKIEDAKLNATPIKENGSIWTEEDKPEDLFCYTDYLSLAIKIPSNTKTIRFSKDDPFVPIDKNRKIGNFYYLNFKWLNLSPDQKTIKAFEYNPDNYILIQMKDIDNKQNLSLILHLSYDLTFV